VNRRRSSCVATCRSFGRALPFRMRHPTGAGGTLAIPPRRSSKCRSRDLSVLSRCAMIKAPLTKRRTAPGGSGGFRLFQTSVPATAGLADGAFSKPQPLSEERWVFEPGHHPQDHLALFRMFFHGPTRIILGLDDQPADRALAGGVARLVLGKQREQAAFEVLQSRLADTRDQAAPKERPIRGAVFAGRFGKPAPAPSTVRQIPPRRFFAAGRMRATPPDQPVFRPFLRYCWTAFS